MVQEERSRGKERGSSSGKRRGHVACLVRLEPKAVGRESSECAHWGRSSEYTATARMVSVQGTKVLCWVDSDKSSGGLCSRVRAFFSFARFRSRRSRSVVDASRTRSLSSLSLSLALHSHYNQPPLKHPLLYTLTPTHYLPLLLLEVGHFAPSSLRRVALI